MTRRFEEHKSLMRGLRHAKEHGDWSLLVKAISGSAQTIKRAQIIAWIEAFSPYRPVFNGADVSRLSTDKDKEFIIDSAERTPYWNFDAVPFVAPRKNAKGNEHVRVKLVSSFRSFLRSPTQQKKKELIELFDVYQSSHVAKRRVNTFVSLVQGGAPGLGKNA